MGRTGHELDDEGGSEEGGQPVAGRPKEANKYGKDSGVRGRDPLGHMIKRWLTHQNLYILMKIY